MASLRLFVIGFLVFFLLLLLDFGEEADVVDDAAAVPFSCFPTRYIPKQQPMVLVRLALCRREMTVCVVYFVVVVVSAVGCEQAKAFCVFFFNFACNFVDNHHGYPQALGIN